MLTAENETKVTLEEGGREIPEDTPFRLLLAGDWSARGTRRSETSLRARRPVEIDRDNFEDVMHRLGVELRLDFGGDGAGVLALHFAEMDDFHPDQIFRRVPLFENLRETRRRLMHAQTFNQAAREVRGWLDEPEEHNSETAATPPPPAAPPASGNLLDQILLQSDDSPPAARTPAAPKSELDALLGKLVRPHLVQTDETEQAKLVAAVDRATGELMRAILHHPEFQALEAAWRGAHLVISRVETDSDLKIYLLDATKDEIVRDLKEVGSLTDSAFYKLLNEAAEMEEPWAAVCGNYVFAPDVEDVATLMRLGKIAQRADTPFVAQGGAKILGVESLAAAPDSSEWKVSDDAPEAKLWSVLRAAPESAYLGLALPRILARLPYGTKTEPLETFSFEESASPPAHKEYVWMNPCFACAVLLAQSFRRYGWEMSQGFLHDVENAPLHIYRENGETVTKAGAEIFMTVRAAERILDEGLMPVISFRDNDTVRLPRLQSIAAPQTPLQGRWTI